jgi:hypothetical protein
MKVPMCLMMQFTRPGPSLPAAAGSDRGGLPKTDCLYRAKIRGSHAAAGLLHDCYG